MCMSQWLAKLPELNLETVFQPQINAVSGDKSCLPGPLAQLVLFKTQPEITARLLRPVLVVGAQLVQDQAAAGFYCVGNVFKSGRRSGKMMQNHVQHNAVN